MDKSKSRTVPGRAKLGDSVWRSLDKLGPFDGFRVYGLGYPKWP